MMLICCFHMQKCARIQVLFVYKLGHDFFVISTLDPQSIRLVDFCTTASIWFKGSREHRISSFCQDPQFTTLDLLMLSSYVPQTLQPFVLENTLHATSATLVALSWNFQSYQSNMHYFVALYDFLCVSTCKLQMQ